MVNSAYFSPSGTKLLTTCIDNRLRVWDSWASGASEPSRQMVHSHDFNRCACGGANLYLDISVRYLVGCYHLICAVGGR